MFRSNSGAHDGRPGSRVRHPPRRFRLFSAEANLVKCIGRERKWLMAGGRMRLWKTRGRICRDAGPGCVRRFRRPEVRRDRGKRVSKKLPVGDRRPVAPATLGPKGIREAFLAEPTLKAHGAVTRYISCLRFNAKGPKGDYQGSKEYAAFFFAGGLTQVTVAPTICARAPPISRFRSWSGSDCSSAAALRAPAGRTRGCCARPCRRFAAGRPVATATYCRPFAM